jgi:hypothetical protein
MHAYVKMVRNRLTEAANAAGLVSNLPARPHDIAVSVVIREAQRCDVTVSSVLDEHLGVEGDL